MRLAMAIATLFLGVAVQAQPFTVAITSSDDPALAAPAARVDTLTTAQESMRGANTWTYVMKGGVSSYPRPSVLRRTISGGGSC